ncbi:hypothetical protein F4777DRAFT_526041 [Nemania sp. FL0916]|nr:hypothetical protein F4777DRAFT_526041 [Nemania sp. FL0916]
MDTTRVLLTLQVLLAVVALVVLLLPSYSQSQPTPPPPSSSTDLSQMIESKQQHEFFERQFLEDKEKRRVGGYIQESLSQQLFAKLPEDSKQRLFHKRHNPLGLEHSFQKEVEDNFQLEVARAAAAAAAAVREGERGRGEIAAAPAPRARERAVEPAAGAGGE